MPSDNNKLTVEKLGALAAEELTSRDEQIDDLQESLTAEQDARRPWRYRAAKIERQRQPDA